MKLIKTINSRLVEGEFDVNDRTLWEIETQYRKAFDIVHDGFPFEWFPFDLFQIGKKDDRYESWICKIKYELEQRGFVKILDSKNVVELHTPTHKVYYKFDAQQIIIYENN